MVSTVATDLDVTRLTAALGAEIRGVDLAALDDDGFARIRELILEHLVVFFPEQNLTPEEQIAFAARFGEVHVFPFPGDAKVEGHPEILVLEGNRSHADTWHTDGTFEQRPALGTILKMVTLPSVGGDTMWTNQYLAYETLSEPLRVFLDDLTAVHSSRSLVHDADELASTHPVVRVHPETGRKCLFVNRTWTSHIVELSRGESDAMLGYLHTWSERPEFQCRYKWTVGTIGFWDNRCTQHYALGDYDEFRRIERVMVVGDVPRGPVRVG
jgi:taurine dioxygenase